MIRVTAPPLFVTGTSFASTTGGGAGAVVGVYSHATAAELLSLAELELFVNATLTVDVGGVNFATYLTSWYNNAQPGVLQGNLAVALSSAVPTTAWSSSGVIPAGWVTNTNAAGQLYFLPTAGTDNGSGSGPTVTTGTQTVGGLTYFCQFGGQALAQTSNLALGTTAPIRLPKAIPLSAKWSLYAQILKSGTGASTPALRMNYSNL